MLTLTVVTSDAMNDWNKLCKRKVTDSAKLAFKIARNVQLGKVTYITENMYKVLNWDLIYTVVNGEVVSIRRTNRKRFGVSDGLKKAYDKQFKDLFIKAVNANLSTLD